MTLNVPDQLTQEVYMATFKRILDPIGTEIRWALQVYFAPLSAAWKEGRNSHGYCPRLRMTYRRHGVF